MSRLLHETLLDTAARAPHAIALRHAKFADQSFEQFLASVAKLSQIFLDAGLKQNDRVGVFLDKQPLSPAAFYAASMAGATFVPINPVLRPAQVAYIMRDCNVRLLVTSSQRFSALADVLADCPDLIHVVFSDSASEDNAKALRYSVWDEGAADASLEVGVIPLRRRIDNDMAAILYTSGSTGKPKGVVISHRNIVEGAHSVAEFLQISETDKLLAVLPFSFDYGLNQLTTTVLTGASCVLLDFLLPKDVVKAIVKYDITGLAAVPPLWAQLAPLEWPSKAQTCLRYITNSGGAMPEKVLQQLREKLPNTAPFLMYGLTEAFRSTYLPPDKIDERPGSMGKAIPNAEILVIKANGEPASANEPGELVHRGALVSLGYWNDPDRTNERFKPMPGGIAELPLKEMAVWSGDTVTFDDDGYLYFVGRTDSMIKTSGYRVSPEEVEEVAYANKKIVHAAAIGVPDPAAGQVIVLIVCVGEAEMLSSDEVLTQYRSALPAFMVPREIIIIDQMPRNANGKIDRRKLCEAYAEGSLGD